MPLNMAVEITTVSGVNVTYRICHAWHSKNEEMGQLFDINLYERNFWGYYVDDEIIVHGHTPTISPNYILRGIHGEERPGMIGYRHNDINVDGGCCFRRGYPEYPCMLCGICLETLEEIYSYTVEERYMENAENQASRMSKSFLEKVPDDENIVQILFEEYMEKFHDISPNRYRQEMLERLRL